jgi:hypothetical protein
MAKITKIEKFLTALYDAGGELARTELAVRVFRRNWSAAQLDALLSAPELQGLVTSKRGVQRGKRSKNGRGRPSVIYFLTGSGWALLKSGLRAGIKPHRINSAECARQFALLVADRDPWAVELSRQAAIGRDTDALQQRKAEEARAARQKEIDAVARYPSAGRKRSAREIEQRAAWAASKGFGPKVQDPAAPAPIAPATPRAPSVPATPKTPLTPEQQAARDFREALGLSSRFYSPSSMPCDCEPIQPRLTDAKELAKSEALSQKIKNAGYTVRADGRVLYSGSWITPEQWVAKMPGVVQ